MSFTSSAFTSDMVLFMTTIYGVRPGEDPHIYPLHSSVSSEFLVKHVTRDLEVDYPTSPKYFPEVDCEITLSQLKEAYFAEYGPYSTDTLTLKIKDVFTGFREIEASESLKRHPERYFVRKMWLFKTLYETFDGSIGLIATRMSKLLVSIYEKAIPVLRDAKTKMGIYPGKNAKKYALMVIEIIRRVKEKVVAIMAQDAKFINLLSKTALKSFVEEAAPWMVAKFSSLPWIEPELALMVAPSYNYYWTEFWLTFFQRNFNISHELCRVIAEYMPIYLKGETFLDFFHRKYDVDTGFKGKRVFNVSRVQEITSRRNDHYLNKFVITLI